MATRILMGMTAVAAAVALTAGSALAAFKGQQYATAAKISIAHARAIALKAVPGGKSGKVLENSVEGPDAD